MLNRFAAAFKAFVQPNPPIVFDVNKLSAEELGNLKAAVATGGIVHVKAQEPLGDGHAEFLGEGTTSEFEAQERKDKGMDGVFRLGKE